MDKAIIISKNQKASEYFEKFLFAHKIRDITHAANAAKARRMMQDQTYSIAIIVAPLPDELGNMLAMEMVKYPETQVLFFAKAELHGESYQDLSEYGIIMQQIPISKVMFEQSFKLARAFSRKVEILLSQTQSLQSKLKELKRIDLAKCLLIEMEGKSEEDAHKTIERMAMDKRKTKIEIAMEIIKKYKG